HRSCPPLMPNAKLFNSEGRWSLAGANCCPSCRFAKRRRRRADVQRQVVARKTRMLVGRRKMLGGGSSRGPARRSRLFDPRRPYLLRKLLKTKAGFMFPLTLVLSYRIIFMSLLTTRVQDMENLNTDDLMKLQVEQLEKEKKDLNQRLRIVAKRVDHIERAYRKEERPLLGQDYEEQQANDRLTFEAVQKARIEGSKISHQRDIETKKRLSRMMDDYKSRRDVIAGKRGDDYARRQAIAAR